MAASPRTGRVSPGWYVFSGAALRKMKPRAFDELSRASRLRFARRLTIVAAVGMPALAGAFTYADFHAPFTSYRAIRLFNGAFLGAMVIAAILTLTGYILISWELPPRKAILLGAASVAIAFIGPKVSLPALEAISVRYPNPFLSHEGGILLFGVLPGVFEFCGAVAITVALIRMLVRHFGAP